MHRGLLLAVFVVAVSAQIQCSTEVFENGELVFVHVVYRHGDRTPFKPYPKDPYKDPSNWPAGWGQLTNVGKRQQRDLGKWLRERYGGLLSETYCRDEIHVRSTDVDRTLMSAQTNLAGLYEPKGADVWDPQILWQPIPIHTERSGSTATKNCPAYLDLLDELEQSSGYRHFDETYHLDYAYMSRHTGKSISNRTDAAALYSVLNIETLNNKTLPEWTNRVYPEPLQSIAAHSFTTSTATRQLARLRTGPLLKDIFHGFTSKIEGTSKLKMKMDSGHDSTVSALLNTLKVFEPHPPPFTACVMLELRMMHGSQPYVTVVYRNDSHPRILEIPGCGVACPLSKMKELYADVIPEDWYSECEGTSSNDFHAEALTADETECIIYGYFNVTFYLLIMALLILLTIILGMHAWKVNQGYRMYREIVC